MVRAVWLLALTLPLAAGEPIPATLVTIEDHPRTLAETAEFLKKQSGFTVDVSKVDGGNKLLLPREAPQPFWSALEAYCRKANCHIVTRDHGRTIALLPGALKAPASVDGPFRIVATGATSKIDYQTGKRVVDISFDLHWEPRLPVFRVSSQPTITSAVDEDGKTLTLKPSNIRSALGDRHAFTATARFENLPHSTRELKLLDGQFTVTAAAKMLSFTFKSPANETKDNVTVSLTKLAASDGRVNVELKLLYPDTHPDFESFESWTDFNKLTLISADRTKTWTPENFSTTGSGRRVAVEYRFPKLTAADIAGAVVVYETPAPLVEFPVKFKLKDISLP